MQADHHTNLQKQKFAANFLLQLMFLTRKLLFINNCCIYLTTEYQLKINSKLLLKKRN